MSQQCSPHSVSIPPFRGDSEVRDRGGRGRWRANMGAMMLAAVGLTACGFPAAAPTPRQIEQWSSDAEFDVYLVKVTGPVVRTVSEYRADGFPQSLRSFAYTPSVRLKPGDVIGVSIYEPSGSQLFSPPPSPMLSAAPGSGTAAPPAATTLPAQVVEPD